MIETDDPGYRTMHEELFGPVVTTYVYDDKRWDDTLELVDEGAPYALTGAVFADDRYADRGGARRRSATRPETSTSTTSRPAPSSGSSRSAARRASGTNDKAGSMWNLIRWVSPRTIKETFVPPTDYRYPFMGPDGAATALARLAATA